MDRVRQPVSKERLESLYIVHELSTTAIAARIGSNRESVQKLIHSYGIPMRSTGEGKSVSYRRGI